MSSDNKNITFPKKWDITNPRAMNYYNLCLPYVDSEDDYYQLLNIFPTFSIFCYIMIIYVIITMILIVINRNKYVIKRTNPGITLLFCCGCLLVISNSLYFMLFIIY